MNELLPLIELQDSRTNDLHDIKELLHQLLDNEKEREQEQTKHYQEQKQSNEEDNKIIIKHVEQQQKTNSLHIFIILLTLAICLWSIVIQPIMK